ncbi:MAG: hypothetical protein ABI210_10540 [Abditibacteriaceae bacterium]
MEDHPNPNAQGAKFTYSWDIVSTKSRTTPTGTWEDAGPTPTITGANNPSVIISTLFGTAAYYQVVVHVSIDFYPGTGEDTWHTDKTVTLSQTAVGVEKIQYRIGQGAYADVPNPLVVAVNSNVDFKAIITPADATWPTNKPVWGGAATGTGENSTVTFNNPGNTTVTAQCGNTAAANVTAVQIDKLQYKINGQGDWLDVTQVINIGVGSNISFQALPSPGDAAWPEHQPTWSHGAQDTGVTLNATEGASSTATFAQAGDKTVTAKCGNSKTAQIKVSASSAALHFYKDNNGAPGDEIDGTSPTIGGKVWVALELDVAAGQRVDDALGSVTLRRREVSDMHTDADDHVDTDISFNGNWEKWTGTDWSAVGNPHAANTSDQEVKYRSKLLWTTTLPEIVDNHKLWGHNGSHEVKLLQNVAFEAGDGSGQPANVTVDVKTPDVENLVIEDAKADDGTTAGNLDYIKFDKDSTDTNFKTPTIRFTIKDKGNANKYLWTIRVIDTNGLTWVNSATIRGKANQPGEVVVKLNVPSKIGLAFGALPAGEYSQDKLLTGWGTYSFDIFVSKVNDLNETDPSKRLDYFALRSPYKLEIPKEQHELRWESDGDYNMQAVGQYVLKAPDNQPATSMTMDLIDPDLNKIGSTDGPLSVNSSPPHRKLIHQLTDDEAIKLGEITQRVGNGETVEKRFIAVFMAEDGYASEYRNHRNKRILAVNDRRVPRGSISAQKIDQDDPANVQQVALSWPAANPPVVYGGNIPSTADNLILQATNLGQAAVPKGTRWYVMYRPFKPGASSTLSYTSINSPPKDVGAYWNFNVEPVPGLYVFGCRVKLQNGKTAELQTKQIEVGVRSDHVLVLANFPKAQLAHPSTMTLGVTPEILKMFPTSGPPELIQTGFATSLLFNMAKNATVVKDVTPKYKYGRMSWKDRVYIMNWLLYYAADTSAPADLLTNDKTKLDLTRVNVLLGNKTNYRCINEAQIKFRVHPSGTRFLNPPVSIRDHREVGITKSPLGFHDVLDTEAQWGPIRSNPPYGFYNMDARNTRVSFILDGTVNVQQIRVANALRSLNLPSGSPPQAYVEAIGSQIRFQYDGQGKAVANSGFYNSIPAYTEYHNGVKTNLGHKLPKVPGGLSLFRTNPYPFGGGTASSVTQYPKSFKIYFRAGFPTLSFRLEGGRFGYANNTDELKALQVENLVMPSTNQVDTGSRVPKFTQH